MIEFEQLHDTEEGDEVHEAGNRNLAVTGYQSDPSNQKSDISENFHII
jgi:hypothetical protein